MNFWITLIIVVITYAGVAVGRLPKLRANRATIAMMGAGLLIACGQIRFDDIGRFLDLDTLILLFSMMIINANLQLAGFFDLAGSALMRLTRSPRTLLALLIVLSGLLSALFLNDTICLMFTPLVLNLTTSLKRNPLPYLIGLATAANIGSVATLTGNPQNMIIGVASGISYLDFSAALLPVALLGMGGIWIVLVLLYPWEFRKQHFEPAPNPESNLNRPLLIKCLLVLVGLLAAFFWGLPVAMASFLAACVLLFTRRVSPEKVFMEFNWGLLVFFAGLFIVTGALEENGITSALFGLVDLTQRANLWNLSLFTVILSNLVSNVPAVLLFKPVIPLISNPQAGWLTLAAASTLAGNLTLLGSVANLIVAEIAGHYRVELGFWEYTRAGLIITALSLLTGLIWLNFFVWA